MIPPSPGRAILSNPGTKVYCASRRPAAIVRMAGVRMTDRVVVAGAGPGGLVTALTLAEHDIPVTIIEAEPSLPENLRASTFHPPTLDMLDRFGATERLIAMGLKAPKFQYRTREGGRFAEFDFGVLGKETRHPYRVQCEQYKLNGVLL